jgi:hypothetical protein
VPQGPAGEVKVGEGGCRQTRRPDRGSRDRATAGALVDDADAPMSHTTILNGTLTPYDSFPTPTTTIPLPVPVVHSF